MIKSDKEILWRPGRIYIPAGQFSGLAYEATTGNAIKSIGTGTPSASNLVLGEVNTSGITGLALNTADNTVCHLMEVPADMDLQFPLYTSLYWTANNTSGSVDWEMFYKAYIPGTTVLGSAEAATAMSKVGAAQTMAAVAYTLMRTPEMKIFGKVFPDTTELIQLTVQMHALVTITAPFLIGMAIRYTPKRLAGMGGVVESKAPLYIGSNKFS